MYGGPAGSETSVPETVTSDDLVASAASGDRACPLSARCVNATASTAIPTVANAMRAGPGAATAAINAATPITSAIPADAGPAR